MWDVRKPLRDLRRSCIRFYKTYDAGCCQHQGVEHRGYRVVFWNTYVLECGLWGTRELCKLCGKLLLMENMWRDRTAMISKGRPVAPANKKEKQGVPPPMPPNLILKEDGTVVKKF